MITLYTTEEFSNAKSRDLLPVKCEGCGATAYRNKHILMSKAYKNTPQYCSLKCKSNHQSPPQYKNCETCNTSVRVSSARLRGSKHIFCSKRCAGKYSSTHRTHGYKISKIEIWIQKKLTELFPSLEILFNQNSVIDNELDIYIPSLKTAFELNGIFHYKPIYGELCLENQKRIDLLKIEKCKQNNINLIVIDISSQPYFKESTSLVYLNQIVNTIKLAENTGFEPVEVFQPHSVSNRTH